MFFLANAFLTRSNRHSVNSRFGPPTDCEKFPVIAVLQRMTANENVVAILYRANERKEWAATGLEA